MGVGARFLGMGKSGLAFSDDCDTIYLNPSGISLLDDWQVSSMMFGKFINEVNFLQFTGVYPAFYGMVGLGFVGSSISYSTPIPTLVSTEGGYRVIPDPSGGTYRYSYNNNAILLSYGLKLKDVISWDIIKNVSLGANLKLFQVGLTGSGITGGSATGLDLDVGLLWQANKWLKVGASGLDILPFDMGGKLIWESGIEESYPSVERIGINAKVMGADAPFHYESQELFINTDMEFSILRDEIPVLYHVGFEWWPMIYLALRAGIDQDVVGTGAGEALSTTNNVTAGVGLLYGGFRFDYGYHQYNNLSENDTHYFSMTYNIWKEPPPKVIKKKMEILEPVNKSIVFGEVVNLKGRVYDPDIRNVKVEGLPVTIDKNGYFYANVSVKIGKNAILVEGFGREDKKTDTLIHKLLRLRAFQDVPEGYWNKRTIEYLGTIGILTGYPDGTFRPNETINRAEETTILIRSKFTEVATPETAPFNDVPLSHWAARYLSKAREEYIAKGYPDGTFRPSNVVNRVEGVTLTARFANLPEPETIIEAPFIDLPGRHWASRIVTAAKRAGLLQYLAGKPFEPTKGLTRAEGGEVLSKTPFSKEKINDLLNFDAGYEYITPEALPLITPALPETKPVPVEIIAKEAPLAPPPAAVPPGKPLTISKPLNNSVVRTDEVDVYGTVSEGVAAILINSIEAPIEKNRSFKGSIYLNPGKNTIVITAHDKSGAILKTEVIAVYKL
ncbi:MAG: S-layer homology domain-containing protein [Candidatus Saganbacteria bacterium]|nr:S-layer homology domain-containing protein [Candidatus Saganbacteria bacterium]